MNAISTSCRGVAALLATPRFEAWGAAREALFTRITNSALVTESARSVSVAWGACDDDGLLDVLVSKLSAAAPSQFLYRGDTNGSQVRMAAAGVGPLASGRASPRPT